MRYLALAAVLLAAAPALSQELTEAEAQVLPRLIDSLCIDLIDARNGCETAVLLASEEEPDAADLVIFSDRRAHDPQSILAVVRNIAFNGPMFGQAPWLEAAENGSLLLQSEQIGIGRNPWSRTLTIAFRDDALLIAGFTHATYDRLDASVFRCDVNILTGAWEVFAERSGEDPEGPLLYQSEETGNIEPETIALVAWDWNTPMPEPCSATLTEWWEYAP
ncbi:hypothetical protein [Gymnodinialimonas hymeniacidonis]|uniref:hypothetical protein n=1 Tax=Gymnodinialimonas hymeniacidonis TaxID=3126508 RepID=UPI0034C62E1A